MTSQDNWAIKTTPWTIKSNICRSINSSII